MAFKKFVSKAELYFSEEGGDEVYLGDVNSVQVTESANDKEVNTFEADGIAGFIDGPVKTDIRFDSAVPRRGARKAFKKIMRAHKDIRVVVEAGDERTEYLGRIMSCNTSYSLDNPSNLNCQIMAGKGTPVE
jgi:hypothetical protein